jgi:hypothetical protein
MTPPPPVGLLPVDPVYDRGEFASRARQSQIPSIQADEYDHQAGSCKSQGRARIYCRGPSHTFFFCRAVAPF